MKKIISYDDIPISRGESIYFRMESDPALYYNLLAKGYHLVNHVVEADIDTIYLTGQRQIYGFRSREEYLSDLDDRICDSLRMRNIRKPKSYHFSYTDLVNHKYQLPFVFKNEILNGGREKYLIETPDDYENLIAACDFLLDRRVFCLLPFDSDDIKMKINYEKYLNSGFTVQEYIETPTEFNTTVRVVTSSSHDVLYSTLKYNEPSESVDDTSLLGFLLREIFPLSTPSIVSNTVSGGENILLGENGYSDFDKRMLDRHHIDSEQFQDVIESSLDAHQECQRELGIICGFDFIYDKNRGKWYMLEYHDKPMVGDYSRRNGIAYKTKQERLEAEGRVRATSLDLVLKKY